MKLREHRGSLFDSLETVVEIEPTLEALTKKINEQFNPFGVYITSDRISVEPYGFDERTGWSTYIVTIKDYGVFGFTDGPLKNGLPES